MLPTAAEAVGELMARRILLPSIFIILTYGFWVSPDFKEIAAGVAIFLFGMLSLEEGFKAFTGGTLERLLHRTTDRLWKSVSFGIVTTTLMQSSSLVSVITISFLSAGLISLAAGIGIVFGANLGTTTGAWLVAGFGLKVKLSAYAMPMLVFGVVLIFQKPKVLKGLGWVLTGVGFLFLGIHHMKEGFESFKQAIELTDYAIPGYRGLFIFAAVGILATVVMQSSHATLVLTLTALASGQVTYENGLALAIGSNVGTTITAILGSIGANAQGRRLAGAHLIFNLVTGGVAIASIHPLIRIVDGFSAQVGIAADDYTLKLAAFHSLFNLLGISLMLPFIGLLERWLCRVFPAPVLRYKKPRYLNQASIEHPDAAIEAVRKETDRLYGHAAATIAHGLGLRRELVLSDAPLEQVIETSDRTLGEDLDERYELNTKSLHAAIIEFISYKQEGLTRAQSDELFELRTACREIVAAVKDVKHLQRNLRVFVGSDNDDIRRAYDAIRLHIAMVLRELEMVRSAHDRTTTLLTLDHVKVSVAEEDVIASGVLDQMIREGRITASMATSLIKDSGYAQEVCSNLIAACQTLYAVRDLALREAERDLLLTDSEIGAVAVAGGR